MKTVPRTNGADIQFGNDITGLHPKYLKDCLGKKVNRDLEKGERMKLEYIQK